MVYFLKLLQQGPPLFLKSSFSHTEYISFSCFDNRNKEKTLPWSDNVILQCDSFKLLKQVLLTFLGEMNYHLNRP